MKRFLKVSSLVGLCVATLLATVGSSVLAVNANPTWYGSSKCFTKGPAGSFTSVTVKDPSIVYYGGKYHVFYTAVNSKKIWEMGYASASTIAGLNTATRTYLSKISSGYFCAPQVFYFEPQKKWYLVFQSGLGATYSTTTNIADPNSWSSPKSFGIASNLGWDYYVICDNNYAYLYNTPSDNSKRIYVRKTTLANFPSGWGGASVAITDTYEGSHVYKNKKDGKFYLIVEDQKDGRYYELYSANSAGGPWTKVNEKWASKRNLTFTGTKWTDNVSHGEFIRAGYNQNLEINDIDKVDFLIQGMKDGNYGEYILWPWELGIIKNYK